MSTKTELDVASLRKFQETFGPVIAAIPAVIEAADRKADLDRATAKMAKDLESARATAADLIAKAEARLREADELVAAGELRRQTLVTEGETAKFAAINAAMNEVDVAKGKLVDLELRITDRSNVLKNVDADAAAALQAAKDSHASEVLAMLAEIKDLESRKASAEKALDTLRSKLG